MTFRFSKSLRLMPGVRLNFSKSGIGASFGMPGARVSLGSRGTHLNLGIPGTGLSYRTRLDRPGGRPSAADRPTGWFNPASPVPVNPEAVTPNQPDFDNEADSETYTGRREFRSAHPDMLSSPHLKQLAELVSETQARRGKISVGLEECRQRISEAKAKLGTARFFLVRPFVSKARIAKIEARLVELERDEGDLTNLLDGTVIDASFELGDEARSEYLHLRDAFSALSRSRIIWDIATSADVNRQATRSAASHAITRTPVTFDLSRTTEFDSEFEALHLHNANGGDLYLYPGLLAVKKPASGFAFLDMRDVDIRFTTSQFIEQDELPSDAEQVGHVWAKSNKDGSADRRFANNYQIPLMRYGEIAFGSRTGLNEVYMISNANAVENFAQALKRYSAALARSTPAAEPVSERVPFDQIPDLEIGEPAGIPSIVSAASILRLTILAAIAAIVVYVLRAQSMLAGV